MSSQKTNINLYKNNYLYNINTVENNQFKFYESLIINKLKYLKMDFFKYLEYNATVNILIWSHSGSNQRIYRYIKRKFIRNKVKKKVFKTLKLQNKVKISNKIKKNNLLLVKNKSKVKVFLPNKKNFSKLQNMRNLLLKKLINKFFYYKLKFNFLDYQNYSSFIYNNNVDYKKKSNGNSSNFLLLSHKVKKCTSNYNLGKDNKIINKKFLLFNKSADLNKLRKVLFLQSFMNKKLFLNINKLRFKNKNFEKQSYNELIKIGKPYIHSFIKNNILKKDLILIKSKSNFRAKNKKSIYVLQSFLKTLYIPRKFNKIKRKNRDHYVLNLVFGCITKNVNLVVDTIAKAFSENRNPKLVLFFVEYVLNEYGLLSLNLDSIILKVKGKFLKKSGGKKVRTSSQKVLLNKPFSLRSLNFKTTYGFAPANTYLGTFGVHLWFKFNKDNEITSKTT